MRRQRQEPASTIGGLGLFQTQSVGTRLGALCPFGWLSIDFSLREFCGRPASFACAAHIDSAVFESSRRLNFPRADSNRNSPWWRRSSGWPVLAACLMTHLAARAVRPMPPLRALVAVRLAQVVLSLLALLPESLLRWNSKTLRPQGWRSPGQTCDLRAVREPQDYPYQLWQRQRQAYPAV